MTEEPKDKQEYPFINETIVPKRKSRIVRRIWTAVFVVCMAVVFGFVASLVFVTSEASIRKWLGLEGQRQPVDLTRPSPSVQPTPPPEQTPEPTKTPTPTPTKAPTTTPTAAPALTEAPVSVTPGLTGTAAFTPKPTDEPEPTAPITPALTPEPTAGAELTQAPENGGEEVPDHPEPTPADTAYSYLQLYQEILAVAKEVSSALVTVEAIEEGVDWFEEIYETRTKTTGLILANDGIDLLILVDIERISGANTIEVYFGDAVVEGRVYSLDKSYGLAVVAVPLAQISTEVLQGVSIGVIAEEEDIQVGIPVIALGAPNGYEGSMEFGMITSLGSKISVTDGQVSYFTADINNQENGYGFVVNLDGEFLGMITHTHKENPTDDIFSVVSLDAVRGVIVKLLNNEKQVYFGIKGQDLPKSVMASTGLSAGVYVSEVENSSPALDAGIKAGDIIVSIGGQPVEGIRALKEVLLTCSEKDVAEVKLVRVVESGVREVTVEITLTIKN